MNSPKKNLISLNKNSDDADILVEYITRNVKSNKVIEDKLDKLKIYLHDIQLILNTIKRLIIIIVIMNVVYYFAVNEKKMIQELFYGVRDIIVKWFLLLKDAVLTSAETLKEESKTIYINTDDLIKKKQLITIDNKN